MSEGKARQSGALRVRKLEQQQLRITYIEIVGVTTLDFPVVTSGRKQRRLPAVETHGTVRPYRFGTLNANLLDILLVVSRTYR